MKLKAIFAILLCVFLCCPAFPQSKHKGRKNSGAGQRGYSNIELQYGQDRHCYTFNVKGGEVSWDYSGPDGSRSGTFRCNTSVNGNVIASECKGVVNWHFFMRFVQEMVEADGVLPASYNMAVGHLESSLSEFECARETSMDAYVRVRDTLLELKNAEGKGKNALWRTLSAVAARERRLKVADLPDYNF